MIIGFCSQIKVRGGNLPDFPLLESGAHSFGWSLDYPWFVWVQRWISRASQGKMVLLLWVLCKKNLILVPISLYSFYSEGSVSGCGCLNLRYYRKRCAFLGQPRLVPLAVRLEVPNPDPWASHSFREVHFKFQLKIKIKIKFKKKKRKSTSIHQRLVDWVRIDIITYLYQFLLNFQQEKEDR